MDFSSTSSENETESDADDDDARYAQQVVEKKVFEGVVTQVDYIKVIAGIFHGYYNGVKGDGYGDEIELQYFKGWSGKRGNYWILANNDYDSREKSDLMKVEPFGIDRRNQFYFK